MQSDQSRGSQPDERAEPQLDNDGSKVRATLLALCERALDARLPYDEIGVAALWSLVEGHAFYEDVFDDLCFAVEHVPGKSFFSREIDFEDWYASEMYDNLWLDIRLMHSGLSPAEMSSIHDSLVERERFTREMVDARIAEARARGSGTPGTPPTAG